MGFCLRTFPFFGFRDFPTVRRYETNYPRRPFDGTVRVRDKLLPRVRRTLFLDRNGFRPSYGLRISGDRNDLRGRTRRSKIIPGSPRTTALYAPTRWNWKRPSVIVFSILNNTPAGRRVINIISAGGDFNDRLPGGGFVELCTQYA